MAQRVYKKPLRDNPNRWVAMVFTFSVLLFATYKILTPTHATLTEIKSPNGKTTARLRKIYYTPQPSYKIDYHTQKHPLWLNLLYLSSYTNVPHQTATETLEWNSNSQLNFKINDTSVWTHTFEK